MSDDAKDNLKLLLVVLVSFATGFFFSGSTLNSLIIGLLTLGVLFALFGHASLESDIFTAMKSQRDVNEIESEKMFAAIKALDQRLSKLESSR